VEVLLAVCAIEAGWLALLGYMGLRLLG